MKLNLCILWPWILQLTLLGWIVEGKYPNEIVDTPIVTCEPDRIIIKIRTSSSNPSHIYAEDFHETPKCMVKDQNKIAIVHGDCGMTTEHMDNPAGSMYRICIAVQIHPFFVTDSDRSYCAQCVYMEANVVDDLEQKLAISEMTPNELEPQFDEASNPHCTYSIRKGAVDGPEVHAAVVGETVFHVWQCNNANVGILVQNCHVEDLQGDKILIVDQQGCGVDQYLFKTPEYTDDLHTAFLESNVFKFVDKSMTRFRCQLRLCVKNRGHGCDAITPPNTCSMVDDDSNVMALSTSTSSSLLAADDVDQPKRSPISRPASPSASSGPPATNNVSPPSTVGRHGVSVEPVNGARPPSMIVNSGSGMPTQQVPNTNTKTIGPPSIRPFGLSTAHIVSGKTNGKDNGAAAAMMSSRRNAAVVAQSPATSNQPASPPGSHQSGYSLRSRRSIMIYGNGSRSLEDGPTPPNAPFNYYNRLQKRHSNSSNSVDLAYNATTTPTTTQHENRKKQLPDLDVVGLIRVLDNPEDLEFYEEKKKSGSNSHKVYVTAETRRYPTSTNELKDSATQVVPLDESAEQTAAELGEKARLIVDTEELDSEKESQRCISPTLYWMLISTLGLLASIQLVGIALFLADRLIFDKTIAKRVNKLLHH